MEENGKRISELEEIRDPTGEEMIPVAINGKNGHVKLKNATRKLEVEYDEESQTLTITGINLTIKSKDN